MNASCEKENKTTQNTISNFPIITGKPLLKFIMDDYLKNELNILHL